MYLNFSSYSLPLSFPQRDGATYVWKGTPKEPLIQTIRVPFTETIPVDIYIGKPIKVPWRRVHFDCSEIVLDHCLHDYSIDEVEFMMQIVYTARCAYDAKYEGLVQHLSIESISLQLKSVDFPSLFVAGEKHRMVATIKRDRRLERLLLGRAQVIETNANHSRLYTWKNKGSNNNYGDSSSSDSIVTPRGLSPRLEDTHSAQVDHDGFSNPFSAFPITIVEDSVVTIQFFNMKDTPPRFIEWSIRWASLVEQMTPPPSPLMKKLIALKPKRKSQNPTSPRSSSSSSSPSPIASPRVHTFKEILNDNVEAEVSFRLEFIHGDSIVLEEIRLKANNYRDSLEAMNDAVTPKTI